MSAAPRTGVLVVADDLTGANATAAGFARTGMRAVTLGADQGPGRAAEFARRFDAVVVSTDSRHSPPAEAAALMRAAIAAAGPTALVCNRVDSTLRGNLGATTAAALDAVRERTGRRAVALCAPAHPEAGRQTVQGRQLLGGVRLEETELARDPRSPLPTSDVAALLGRQAALRTAHLPLAAVTGEPAELRALVATSLAGGAEVLIADALTTEHLDRIARAAVTAAPAEAVWLGVDPGPASVALARALGLADQPEGAPVLAVSGSATRLTRLQLARLRAEHPVTAVRMPASPGQDDTEKAALELAEALGRARPGEVVLLATVLDDTDVVERIGPDAAERLPGALARTVRRALERHAVDGLFATGGDVSAALFAELGAHGLDVEEELVPLAVAGTFVGGPWAGLPVVTKGGLVGDAGTTSACVTHLWRAASAARRQVRAADTGGAPP
ncbi:four-carbon acid sugar kinase family protein [Streptomyces iconiensis]|uniref:Four-carbon acid sugar kinase family protein n=1 Tax=Streptomyces iconiensis TaxID=1384038 RepID=A0ABT7A1Z4_9ACTN|nr:four-carbon acid sugar kinase family protein [Streptomyces iconiensis]MDJ1134638.1 four-carbon acid sugar kinase family protein [Streptomyces iconiensis]